MKCPFCGYDNKAGAKFCKNCGKKIENVPKESGMQSAQDASYISYEEEKPKHTAKTGKTDGMKVALIGACVVLVAAIGLLVFALVSGHRGSLKADESGKEETGTEASVSVAQESPSESEDNTGEAAEDVKEDDAGDADHAAAASTVAAGATVDIGLPTEEAQEEEASTDAGDTGSSLQDNVSYYTPAGEAELPSAESEKSEKKDNKSKKASAGDYVYEEAVQYPDDFYFASSDSLYLDEDDLKGLTEYECDIARNEIYARHGYTFQTEKFADYFKQFAWYEEDPGYSDARLNKYEKKNASMILDYEKDKGWK